MAVAREMRNQSKRDDQRVSRLLVGQAASADPVVHSLPPKPQTDLEAAVLAAGGSRRFGSPKQLAVVEGSPMISVALQNLLNAGVLDIMVIVGASAKEMVSAIRDYPVYPILNGEWAEGLGASIRRAASTVHPETEGLLLYLGDQPWIPPGAIKLLADAFRASDALAVQPTHQGRPGHPVIFRRQLFPELIHLSGDIGARDVLRRHRDRVLTVSVDNPAICRDVDFPSDLDGQGRDEAT
jgi:molybdenum cofactor cytidylyltransferase